MGKVFYRCRCGHRYKADKIMTYPPAHQCNPNINKIYDMVLEEDVIQGSELQGTIQKDGGRS